MGIIYLDSFTTLDELPRNKRNDYELVKEIILKSGKISDFDIDSKRRIKLFEKLKQDPDMEIKPGQYPYQIVIDKRKQKKGKK